MFQFPPEGVSWQKWGTHPSLERDGEQRPFKGLDASVPPAPPRGASAGEKGSPNGWPNVVAGGGKSRERKRKKFLKSFKNGKCSDPPEGVSWQKLSFPFIFPQFHRGRPVSPVLMFQKTATAGENASNCFLSLSGKTPWCFKKQPADGCSEHRLPSISHSDLPAQQLGDASREETSSSSSSSSSTG